MPPPTEPPRVLVTGASRGLGLGLCRALLARDARVAAVTRGPAPDLEALARDAPERLEPFRADVRSEDDVRSMAAEVGERLGELDVLVNNAGVNPGRHGDLAGLRDEDAREAFEVNVLGPLRVTRALLPHLARGARIVLVSSRMGSMAVNESGGAWAYRISKAALNMACVNLARELRERAVCVAVHPGWVRTDMGGPEAPLSVEESTGKLATLIEGLGPEQHGRFLDVTGAEVPW